MTSSPAKTAPPKVKTFSLPRRENTGKNSFGPKIVEIHRKSIHVIRYLSALSRWGWQGSDREKFAFEPGIDLVNGEKRPLTHTLTHLFGLFPAVPGMEFRGTARSPRRRPHRSPLLVPQAALSHPGAKSYVNLDTKIAALPAIATAGSFIDQLPHCCHPA
jgi:hypothetical protein